MNARCGTLRRIDLAWGNLAWVKLSRVNLAWGKLPRGQRPWVTGGSMAGLSVIASAAVSAHGCYRSSGRWSAAKCWPGMNEA